MSTWSGALPAYFHPQPELRESRTGRRAARDCVDGSAPGSTAAAPFWTVPQNTSTTTHRTIEAESTPVYTRPSPQTAHVGDGSMRRHHVATGIQGAPPSVLPVQPPQRVRSASVHLHHAVAGVGTIPRSPRTGQAPQARQLSDAAAAACQLNRSSSGWNPNTFRARSGLRDDLQGVGNANAPRPQPVETPSLHFTPPGPNQAWEERVATAFAQRAHPSALQVRSWEPSEATGMLPPFLVNNDASSAEPMHAQSADDHDVHTFLCEWTDEHGTCNMDILGDRVWMSHHLSRHHNVIGHERSQRACLWRGCTDTMNKGSLARHVVSRHLRAGASCGFCSKVYSRVDVARRHTKKCKVANGVLGQHDQTK